VVWRVGVLAVVVCGTELSKLIEDDCGVAGGGVEVGPIEELTVLDCAGCAVTAPVRVSTTRI
jgi:hypothetical protein